MRWEIQEHAAEALKALGPVAAAAAPSLVECLKDVDKKVGCEAAQILGKTGVATKPVRDALLLALNDGDTAYYASHSLGVLGRAETNVIYELMEVAKRGKKPAVYWAAVSFVELGAKSKPALPVLIDLISHPTPESDWEAVKAIGMIGPDAASAVPALVKVLEDGGSWARKCAAISLGRIGPAAITSIPILRSLLESEIEDYTKADVARALWQIDPAQLKEILPLAESLVTSNLEIAVQGEGTPYALMSALDLLGEIGTNAIAALPTVLEASGFDDPLVQLSASWAAWRIDASQRHMTTNALWKLVGAENYPLEDFKMFTGLAESKRERESYHLRIAAVAMLWQIGPESRAMLQPIMRHLLKQWNHWTSMKSIIPQDQALAPVLRELLSDDSCRDIHSLVEAVFDKVTSADAERW